MKKLKNILAGILIGCIGSGLAIVALHFGKLTALEGVTFDLRARTLSRPGPATDDIRIILLDQQSLDWAQKHFGLEWPWPRQTFVPLVEFCRQAKAASLTFDTVLSGPSILGKIDDNELTKALKKMEKAVLAADFTSSDGDKSVWPQEIPKPSLGAVGKPLASGLTTAKFPASILASGAAGVGNAAIQPDPDGVIRRIPMIVDFDSTLVPSLPLAARHAALPEPVSFSQKAISIGPHTFPVSPKGEVVLNFRNKNAYKVYSAAAILESGLLIEDGKTSHIPLSEFQGKHVLFGLYDLRTSPFGGGTPSVVINATALDNLLSGDFLRPLDFTYDVATTIIFAVLAGLGVAAFQTGWVTIGLAGTALLGPVILGIVSYRMNIWAGMAPQYTGVIVTFLLAGAYKYATQGRREQVIKAAFGHYLSPSVIDQLLDDSEAVTLTGERREMTILRSNIEGFSDISEKLSPNQLIDLLSEYQTMMTDIIREEGGTVDQSSGPIITAFWNAPALQSDHAIRGVRAALRCKDKVTEMNSHLLSKTGCELQIRIGIHTGQAVAGDIGSNSFFNYSIVGRAVDLAARIEEANKQFGSRLLISRTTMNQLDGKVHAREISSLRAGGDVVAVFEPISDDRYESFKDTMAHFSTGLNLFYEGNFAKAIAYFGVIVDKDPVAASYVAKCKSLHRKKPAQWDGVWDRRR